MMAAGANGWIDGDKVMMESLIAFQRAGADGALATVAPRVAAERLKRGDATPWERRSRLRRWTGVLRPSQLA